MAIIQKINNLISQAKSSFLCLGVESSSEYLNRVLEKKQIYSSCAFNLRIQITSPYFLGYF